jgi:hypothetical protein
MVTSSIFRLTRHRAQICSLRFPGALKWMRLQTGGICEHREREKRWET